jgi:hypothetical protein
MNPFDLITLTDFRIAAFFLIMGAIGFLVFRKEKAADELSEEDKADVKKNKRIGYAVSGAQIVIGLYFLLKHFKMLDELIF